MNNMIFFIVCENRKSLVLDESHYLCTYLQQIGAVGQIADLYLGAMLLKNDLTLQIIDAQWLRFYSADNQDVLCRVWVYAYIGVLYVFYVGRGAFSEGDLADVGDRLGCQDSARFVEQLQVVVNKYPFADGCDVLRHVSARARGDDQLCSHKLQGANSGDAEGDDFLHNTVVLS